jgi:hypothetical protein
LIIKIEMTAAVLFLGRWKNITETHEKSKDDENQDICRIRDRAECLKYGYETKLFLET